MAAICGNTGVPVGTETCKLCVSHGCEGYKQATKQDKQWNYNLEKAPLDTPLKLLSGDDCFLLPQREYIGTITMHRGGKYRTRGECIDGDPEYFYRSTIVAWKTIE